MYREEVQFSMLQKGNEYQLEREPDSESRLVAKDEEPDKIVNRRRTNVINKLPYDSENPHVDQNDPSEEETEVVYTEKTRKLRAIVRLKPIMQLLLADARRNIKHKEEITNFKNLVKKLNLEKKFEAQNKVDKKDLNKRNTMFDKGYTSPNKGILSQADQSDESGSSGQLDGAYIENDFMSSNHAMNYQNYEISDQTEKALIGAIIYIVIDRDMKDYTLAQRKLINLARVWLEQPELILFEERALIIDELEDPFYFRQFFDHMADSSVVCITKGLGNTYHMNKEVLRVKYESEKNKDRRNSKFQVDFKNEQRFREFVGNQNLVNHSKNQGLLQYFDKYM